VEALDDAVGLRALGLGSGVVDVLDREIELVFVAVVGSAAAREMGILTRSASSPSRSTSRAAAA
jgi:hypothetical protein